MSQIVAYTKAFETARLAADAAEKEAESAQWDIALYIRKVSDQFIEDEQLRRLKIKELQRDYYLHCLSGMLGGLEEFADLSEKKREALAWDILAKKTRVSGKDGPDYRTPEEERMYGALRVRWTRLMQLADSAAVDDRGGVRLR